MLGIEELRKEKDSLGQEKRDLLREISNLEKKMRSDKDAIMLKVEPINQKLRLINNQMQSARMTDVAKAIRQTKKLMR